MKKMTATKVVNGETKTVTVWLDDRTVKALEQVNDEAFTNRYILDEYEISLVERRETRRHQSLDASMDNGFEVADEHDYESDVFDGIEKERLKAAFEILTEEQRELVSITETVKRYNEAVRTAEPRLFDLYVCLYVKNNTQESAASELCWSTVYVQKLHTRLVLFFQAQLS